MALIDGTSPVVLNLYIHKGDSFSYAVEYQNNDGSRFNVSAYTVTWTFDVHGVVLTCTVANGKILVADNIIYLNLTNSNTASIPGIGRHGLVLNDGSETQTILEGDVIISV